MFSWWLIVGLALLGITTSWVGAKCLGNEQEAWAINPVKERRREVWAGRIVLLGVMIGSLAWGFILADIILSKIMKGEK